MKGIRLSEKYGINPTIPVCFWCRNPKNEIALLGKIGKKGEDLEAPRYSMLDFEPCEKCLEGMKQGFTVFEVTNVPNTECTTPIQHSPDIYPTSRYAVIKPDAAREIFREEVVSRGKCFVNPELYEHLFSEAMKGDKDNGNETHSDN